MSLLRQFTCKENDLKEKLYPFLPAFDNIREFTYSQDAKDKGIINITIIFSQKGIKKLKEYEKDKIQRREETRRFR